MIVAWKACAELLVGNISKIVPNPLLLPSEARSYMYFCLQKTLAPFTETTRPFHGTQC